MDTTQTVPQPSRHDSHATFAVSVHEYLKADGVPDLITDSEAHRLAARFGLGIYNADDHTTPVPRAALARAIARRVHVTR